MTGFNRTFILLVFASSIGSCTTANMSNLKPALLSAPSIEVRKHLESTVSALLSGRKIQLANNVFVYKSKILVEQNVLKDKQGKLLDGRNIHSANVDSFSLLTDGNLCFVRHNQSGKVTELASIKCNTE